MTIWKVPAAMAALATATLMSATATSAQDSETVDHFELGVLNCDVGEGSGFVIGSSKELLCTFNPAQEPLADEIYAGEITRWGLDIGETTGGEMAWLVVAPTEQEYYEGALNGDYVGVSAEATFGAGLGANVMTGGSEDTLALQPLSLGTQQGLNLAVGVGEITLQRIES